MERLQSYITQIRGISYSPNDVVSLPKDGYVPLLKANNIQNGKLDLSDIIYVKSQIVKPEQLIRKGDILIAASSGSKNIVGKSVFFSENISATFGAFCKVVRPNNNIYAPFVKCFFNTDLYRRHITRVIQGANINNLRTEDIDSLKIPMFSLEEQVKIAHLLTQAENLIAQRKESITLIDEYIKSVFLEMFGDPFINPQKFDIVLLENIAKEEKNAIVDGPFGSSLKEKDYLDSGIPIIRINNIREGGFYSNEFKYIGEDKYEKLIRSKVVYNDILIARVGNTIGKTCVFDQSYKALLSTTGVAKASIDERKANIVFVSRLLKLPQYKSYIWNQTEGGGQPYLNLKKIKSFQILLPPIDLQNRFASIVTKAEALKQQMQQSLQELETLFVSLSQRAFKGELALGKLKVTYEEEYSATNNDRTEPKPIDWEKVSVAKKPISEMNLDDYYGIPEEVQQEHGSIEQHGFDWEFFFKEHFLDRPVTSDVVEDLYAKYNYERGLDFSFDEFTNIVFTELQKEDSYLKQIFSKDDKKIELRIAP